MKILFSDIALKAHPGENIWKAKKNYHTTKAVLINTIFNMNVDVQNDFTIGHWSGKSYFTHVWEWSQ